MSRILITALALSFGAAAHAEVPRVVTDISPVQGLAAQVMKGLGEPVLLVQPGASPHGYSLRPSEASALEKAQVVFFVGPELTPWLEKPIETLAAKADHIELLAAKGTVTLPNRSGATFEPHDHGDHADEGHDHDHAHDHDHGHDHDHAHDHGDIDPHAWLDPENGKAWLAAIAAELSRLDPANAETYAKNAAEGVAEIDAAAADAKASLAGMGDAKFIVFHDAYQYFERRMGITAAGSISLSDASQPSPARIAELRAKVREIGATCALSEPQFNADLLKTVFEGTDAKTAILDPLGTEIAPGAGFYPALIRSLGTELSACK